MQETNSDNKANVCLSVDQNNVCASSDASTDLSNIADQAPMTKSKLKKLKRWEQRKVLQIEKRKNEKEKKKAKRQQTVQKILESGGTKEDIYRAFKRPKFTLMKDSKNKFKVVIDMNFEEYMNESELSKAVQQVGRIYALNRHSESPAQLHVTSLTGKVKDKFLSTNTGYLNWDINTSEQDYLKLFRNNCDSQDDNKPCNIVYLSGDSENTLPQLDKILEDESIIFVIGGLVDHNRHKGLCHKKAVDNGIATAKLPINENLTLCQRHVLSTVAVFEILIKVLGSHMPWRDALVSSIPKRKIASESPKNEKDIKTQQNVIPTSCTNNPGDKLE